MKYDYVNIEMVGGTPFTENHDPKDNWKTIDDAITTANSASTEAAANTLKTAMLTNAVAGTGASIALAEPTGGGTSVVTMTAPALTGDRVITVPDAAVNLGNIAANGTAISNLTDGTTARTGVIKNTQNVGVAGTNVTAVEYGDGVQHTTVLTLTNVAYTIAAAANEIVGALIYTFPAGVHLHKVTYMDVALQGGGVVNADTPDIGIGSVIGTGAFAVLGGTATFEDYVDGSAAADCNGTATVVGPVGATAGILTGISLNAAADSKAINLNFAAGWTGADTVNATGTVVLEWTTIA